MSKQSAERMSKEQPIVQTMVNDETPGGAFADDDTPEHFADVVKVVNFAFGWIDAKFDLFDRLELARIMITQMREKSNVNSRSVLLRDVERYLWGRVYVPAKVKDGSKPLVAKAEAALAGMGYQTMKAGLMATNSLFGTKWGLSNPDRPFSPLGGELWYQFGLEHYNQYDEAHITERCEPYRPTVEEAKAFAKRFYMASTPG